MSSGRGAHLDVAALQSQAEAGLLVLDEVQRHLGVALLLQVGDDGLAHQLGVTHHVEHLGGSERGQGSGSGFNKRVAGKCRLGETGERRARPIPIHSLVTCHYRRYSTPGLKRPLKWV